MTASPVSVYKTAVSRVIQGGVAVTPIFGGILGGFITNPQFAADQGIPAAEVLFVDITGATATLGETATSIPLQPGQTYVFVNNQATNVSVNAVTSGHKFSGVVLQPPTQFPPTPQAGTFPPPGPTTLTQIIPSYLYEEYADDDDLQAFVASYNALAQTYVSYFANVNLAVYTDADVSGSLLDWSAAGIYGMTRPALSSGKARLLGPLNTYSPNTIPLNFRKLLSPSNVVATSDDVFKRIMTWNFYKGDGNIFNVRWLKRRIMRFLLGPNGTSPNIDQTYVVSVTFGNGAIAIRLTVGTRKILGGALYNRMLLNKVPLNSLRTAFIPGQPHLQLESVLKEAFDSGALTLPFQYSFSIIV